MSSEAQAEKRQNGLFSGGICVETHLRCNGMSICGCAVRAMSGTSDRKRRIVEQIELLERKVVEVEQCLVLLQRESARNQKRFSAEVARLRLLLNTIDKAQKIRYRSVMGVFTENFQTLGQLDARIEDLVRCKQRYSRQSLQTSIQKLIWYVADCVFATLIGVTRLSTGLALIVYHAFAQNQEENNPG